MATTLAKLIASSVAWVLVSSFCAISRSALGSKLVADGYCTWGVVM